ncbi:MAG: hypothetical protein J1E07_10210 [Treponema sp.]|nr:hypothetical protein [Treponema sp.]
MSEQFDNAMMLARDAYRANNEEECKSFCNQALTVDPKSANAKALKGAAVLISFSLAGAESDAVEAIEIWRSISDASSLSDEYKDIVIEAAFEFRTRWYDAAKAHYKEFKEVDGTKAEWKSVQQAYNTFMECVSTLGWIQDYPKFLQQTLNLIQKGVVEDVAFAQALINVNSGKSGEVGELTKKIEEEFTALKKRVLKTNLIIAGVIAVVVIILMIIGHFTE